MTAAAKKKNPAFIEFVIVISLMMSMTALSIDAMLPALPQMGADLGVQDDNQRQLVVSVIFLGLAAGGLFFGPLSDKTGRKPAVALGYFIFIIGSLVSVFAGTFNMLLAGRVLQGVGISGPRSIVMAVVRDRYEGRAMARVMSFAMTVFILVPMIAPSMGQAILLFANWRGIFWALIILSIGSMTWYLLRIPETLAEENRSPFNIKRLIFAGKEIVNNRTALGYTISAGLISGAFLGYLNSAQQIFAEQYELGDKFPLIFAVVSFAIGFASFLNARLVMRFGMRALVKWSLRIILGLTAVALAVSAFTAGNPPFWFFMAYLMLTFFCIGILFGNQNAIAMDPLGHLAGIGAAVVGSAGTLIQTPIGTLIGQNYNGTIFPLVMGIALMTLLSMLTVRWAERG